jgi:hypothetical protein
LKGAVLCLNLDEVVENVMQRINNNGYDKLAGIISTVMVPALMKTLNMQKEDAETIIGSLTGRYLENIEIEEIKNSALRNTIMRNNPHTNKRQLINECLALIEYISKMCVEITGAGGENRNTNFR